MAAIGCGWRLRTRLGPWLSAGDALRILLLTVAVGALSAFLPGRSYWLLGELALIGVAYALMLALTGLVTLRDLRRATGRGPGVPGGPGSAAGGRVPDEP